MMNTASVEPTTPRRFLRTMGWTRMVLVLMTVALLGAALVGVLREPGPLLLFRSGKGVQETLPNYDIVLAGLPFWTALCLVVGVMLAVSLVLVSQLRDFWRVFLVLAVLYLLDIGAFQAVFADVLEGGTVPDLSTGEVLRFYATRYTGLYASWWSVGVTGLVLLVAAFAGRVPGRRGADRVEG